MRYWHPLSDETARAVRDWQPDEVVLLPLYPHYSTTTTGSSLTAWREAAARAGLVANTVTRLLLSDRCRLCRRHDRIACCGLRRGKGAARSGGSRCACFFQPMACRKSSYTAATRINGRSSRPLPSAAVWREQEPDWSICYQSRATPQTMDRPQHRFRDRAGSAGSGGGAGGADRLRLGPYRNAGGARRGISGIGGEVGCARIFRVPAQNSDPGFIAALARLVRYARSCGPGLCSHAGGRVCPVDRSQCPHRALP